MAEFKISTNIVRDANSSLDYIVTKNANEVYDRIIYNYGRNQHAFTIIGSYGTGKSTFLWALEKHMKGEVKFAKPVNGEFKGINKFDFVRIVGDSSSLKERFCEAFGFTNLKDASNKAILREFDDLYQDISRRKHALVILVDEFGKHLEFIAKANPDEMYFIQELAEYCNDSKKDILLISTLHQNFSVYSKGLSKAQRSEWDKVRGRFIDIAFDEPVEQLLYFAAKRLEEHFVPNNFRKNYNTAVQLILDSQLLGKSFSLKQGELEKLYPLDPLAADILTRSLQRYGQNERSLFTFLDSPELKWKIDSESPFTVADCFDYLTANLQSEIEDGEKNPFKPQWKAAILALEKAEFIFDNDYLEASNVIKLICLANIFSNSVGTLDDATIIGYSETILKVKDGKQILDKLKSQRIIKFSNHRSKYNFIEGTDVDIEQELIDAAKYVDYDFDLVSRIESYFEFSIIPAKRIQFQTGTPRFFAFRFYTEIPPNLSQPEGEIDGYINLIFSKKRIEASLRSEIQNYPANQLFVLFKEIDQIRETLFEIDKINYVIGKFSDDKVALRILNEEKLFKNNQLKDSVEGALFSGSSKITWIWNDQIDSLSAQKRKIHSYRDLNRLLSDAAEVTFSSTPVYRNEMVNKEFLSSPILTARKALIRQMINNGDQKDLNFDPKTFPPEKTIYLSFLKNTGIHRENGNQAYFDEPSDKSFFPIWQTSNELLASSKDSKIPVADFIKELKTGSFKLKQGFIDFWLPIFLIIKKEEYSLYYEDGEYIPLLTPDVMDLVYKHPTKYFVKTLSAAGVQGDYLAFYKELTGYNESNIKGLKTSYITIYSNFLRFYRGLEDYSKKTKNLPKTAIGIRTAIATASDPETALFQNIPEALGYFGLEKNDKRLQNFLNDLQQSIRQIRGAYDQLIDSLEREISERLLFNVSSFDSFKEQIVNRFGTVNRNLIMNDSLRIFYTRVVSPLDVKKAYWESLCDATLGKKLDKLTDEEIPMFIDRLKSNFEALQDLSELHGFNLSEGDNVFQVSITDKTGASRTKKNIIVTNEQLKKAKDLEKELTALLSSNEEVNKVALLSLLEKELKKQ
jgi:hypothetical protein